MSARRSWTSAHSWSDISTKVGGSSRIGAAEFGGRHSVTCGCDGRLPSSDSASVPWSRAPVGSASFTILNDLAPSRAPLLCDCWRFLAPGRSVSVNALSGVRLSFNELGIEQRCSSALLGVTIKSQATTVRTVRNIIVPRIGSSVSSHQPSIVNRGRQPQPVTCTGTPEATRRRTPTASDAMPYSLHDAAAGGRQRSPRCPLIIAERLSSL
jgi:hypothetical protein